MKVVADFSHFVCVCERLLEDREGDLATIMTRAIHVHGRVGHEEGPQVSDPRAPEWAPHVERHFDWWTMMRKTARARGAESFTFTPEFGPPGYMQTLPFTRQPVADLRRLKALLPRTRLLEQFLLAVRVPHARLRFRIIGHRRYFSNRFGLPGRQQPAPGGYGHP